MADKILVTTRSFQKMDGPHQQILRDAGYELIYNPYDRPLKAHELAEHIGDVVAAILGVDECTAEVVQQARSLRVISRFGVGVDRVDLEAATAQGIVVTNTPGANRIPVAELTMAFMLALARQIPLHDRLARQEDWPQTLGTELNGSVLGLIGMGRIGQEVAQRAAAFNMKILYHDPVPPPQEFLDRVEAAHRPLNELYSDSDFLSLHLPLTESTHHLVDRTALEQMKSSAFLINTARGDLVDEEALYEALSNGVIAGAASDVFSQEPPIGSPLIQLDNFIATPHIAGATTQTTVRMGLMASENALAVLRGERPSHVVNPEVYDLAD